MHLVKAILWLFFKHLVRVTLVGGGLLCGYGRLALQTRD